MHRPGIKTAIPLQRYQLGAFSITVLGDIDSADAVQYRYILAVPREGEREPGLYLTSDPAGSECRMRIIMRDGEDQLGSSERWCALEEFVEDALSVVKTALNLQDESPHQLL